MRALVLATVLAAAPQVARADGWFHCGDHPDAPDGCNASGTDSTSVGSGLLLIGAVAYGLSRRKRRS
jgi:MYXO-CTERM domain-containing protein